MCFKQEKKLTVHQNPSTWNRTGGCHRDRGIYLSPVREMFGSSVRYQQLHFMFGKARADLLLQSLNPCGKYSKIASSCYLAVAFTFLCLV